VDFFYLEYKNFKGHLLDATIGLEYNIWKHFGAGLAYNFFYMRVDVGSESSSPIKLNGNAEFSFGGLMLYAKIMFSRLVVENRSEHTEEKRRIHFLLGLTN